MRAPRPLLLAAVAVAAATAIPLVYLAERAMSRGAGFVVAELLAPRTAALIGRSLLLVTVVTAASVLLGVGLAVLLARTDLAARRVWAVALMLPLAVPSYLMAFLWVSLFPRFGGLWGSALTLTLVCYPLVLMTTLAALTRVDPGQEEVARTLGRGGAAVLFGVTLRQVRPAVTAGALLVALYVLSDFGAVAAMRYEAFTWVIYGAYRSGFNPARAAVLSLLLLVFAMVLVAGERWARGRAEARVGSGAPRPAPVSRLGRRQPVAQAAAAAVLLVALAVPGYALSVWLSAGGLRFDGPAWVSAMAATVWLSAAAALVTTVAALPLAVLAARYRSPGVRLLESVSYLSHGLPGVVVAIAMVSVGVALLRPIYQREPLLILAYAVLFIPLALGSARAAVEAVPPRLDEVARSLGRPPLRAFLGVSARISAPGIAAAAILVLLTCMKELPVTLLLHPTGTHTLATRMWGHSFVSDYAAAAPYALALLLFAAIPTAALGVWTTRAPAVAHV
ncbi:ABC transporter permease [Mycolicibacterium brumae]|nr:hypothetical protein MBRU_01065 [Mycolicibacterium brumae DSM 44177]